MPPKNNNAVRDSTSTGFGSHRIYANISINGRSAGKWMFDTGADISIMSAGLAKQLGVNTSRSSGNINLVGVGSTKGAPLVNVSMKIENQAAFNTQIAVANSNFNLISRRDMNQSYDVVISASGVKLNPKSAGAALNTITPSGAPSLPQLPQLDLSNPDQMKLLVIAVVFVMILGVLA